jgi:aspartyl-tRNA(Asn)/glutamyl-tRNA(Gln) amidotransferase subunit A
VRDLTSLSLAEARDGLKAKCFSAVELANAHIAAIEKARALNAYVLETPERAIEMAQVSDARLVKGEARPLEGVPLHVLHPGRTHDRLFAHPEQLHPHI